MTATVPVIKRGAAEVETAIVEAVAREHGLANLDIDF
jgi:hypothetical protein